MGKAGGAAGGDGHTNEKDMRTQRREGTGRAGKLGAVGLSQRRSSECGAVCVISLHIVAMTTSKDLNCTVDRGQVLSKDLADEEVLEEF